MVVESEGIFIKHRAIDRFLGRRYSRGQSKEALKLPIRDILIILETIKTAVVRRGSY